MNFTKKIDRAFQWAGEKMGGEAKTTMSDGFKMLETEMALRFEGELSSVGSKRWTPGMRADTRLSRHGASPKIDEPVHKMARSPPRLVGR
jgi:hypothetical protein